MDFIKNLKVTDSLDFAKGLANSWETFPKTFAISYDDDDYYIKTVMTTISTGLSKIDLSSKFYYVQQITSEVKDALSGSFYNFIVNAKFYSFIYKPLEVITICLLIIYSSLLSGHFEFVHLYRCERRNY